MTLATTQCELVALQQSKSFKKLLHVIVSKASIFSYCSNKTELFNFLGLKYLGASLKDLKVLQQSFLKRFPDSCFFLKENRKMKKGLFP